MPARPAAVIERSRKVTSYHLVAGFRASQSSLGKKQAASLSLTGRVGQPEYRLAPNLWYPRPG